MFQQSYKNLKKISKKFCRELKLYRVFQFKLTSYAGVIELVETTKKRTFAYGLSSKLKGLLAPEISKFTKHGLIFCHKWEIKLQFCNLHFVTIWFQF